MFVLASILSLITLVISVPIFLVFGLGSSIAAIGGPQSSLVSFNSSIIWGFNQACFNSSSIIYI